MTEQAARQNLKREENVLLSSVLREDHLDVRRKKVDWTCNKCLASRMDHIADKIETGYSKRQEKLVYSYLFWVLGQEL